MAEDITQEQIDQHYAAMLDSVLVINNLVAEAAPYLDTTERLRANVDHLTQMRAKAFWTTEDFTAINAAITNGEARIAEVEASGVARPAYWFPTKDTAKRAVNNWIDGLLTQVTAKYPRHEIDSWAVKNEAARAVIAGTARTDQSKLIQDEADKLGRNLTDQANRIIANADHFSALISATSGMRQSVHAAIDTGAAPEDWASAIEAGLAAATTEAEAFGLTVA